MKSNLSFSGAAVKLSLDEREADSRSNLDAVLDCPANVASCSSFAASSPISVSHSADSRVLCVLQREFAVVGPKVDVVGCDDLTNTVVLFLRLGDCVACGHFDDGILIGTARCGVRKMVHELEKHAKMDSTACLRAWIVGGFEDDKRNSANVLGLMLAALNALDRAVDLQLVCSEKRNDHLKQGIHFPRVMGVAFFRAEDKIVPASFTHLGPGVGLRCALAICGVQELMKCYDTEMDEIEILFEYLECEMASDLLITPDEFLLENVAGCPKQEPPRFLTSIRAGLQFLVDNPDYEKTFANGPLRFKRGPIGAWIKTAK